MKCIFGIGDELFSEVDRGVQRFPLEHLDLVIR